MFVSDNPMDLTVPLNGGVNSGVNYRSRRLAFSCSESHPINLSRDFRISSANCWAPVNPREEETLPQKAPAGGINFSVPVDSRGSETSSPAELFRQRCAAVGIISPGQSRETDALPVCQTASAVNCSPPAFPPEDEEPHQHLADRGTRHSPLAAVEVFRQRCAAVPVRLTAPAVNSFPPTFPPEEPHQHLADPDTNILSPPAENRSSTARRGAVDFCTTPFRSPDEVASPPKDDIQLKNAERYSAGTLKLALDKIRTGELSVYKAGKNYGIPRSTLQFRLSDQYKQNNRPGPATVLTADEERKLVKWIFEMQKKGFPVTAVRVQLKVADFVNTSGRSTPFKEGMPGKNWLSGFFSRHPDIAVRTPEGVSSASALVSEVDLRGWFTKVLSYAIKERLTEALLDPTRKINGDEIGFFLFQLSKKVLAKKGSRDVMMVEAGDPKKNLTVLFSFSADGYAFPPDVILPYERIPAEVIQSFPGNWGLGKSKKGWMDAKNFMLYIEKILHPDLLKRGVTFPVIFFVDGHSSHTAYMAAEACLKLGIVLVCLHPNSTRIIQPADVGVFGPLKTSWRKILEKLPTNESVTITTFADHLQTAMNESFKQATIKSAFRACGLHPFDQNAPNYSKCLGKSSASQKDANQSCGNSADESNVGQGDPNVSRPAQVTFEDESHQTDESFCSPVHVLDDSVSVLGPTNESFSVQTYTMIETHQLDLTDESDSTPFGPGNESFPAPAFFVNESYTLQHVDETIRSNESYKTNDFILSDDPIRPNETIRSNASIMTNENILLNDPIRPNETILSNMSIRPNDFILPNNSVLPNDSILQNDSIQLNDPIRSNESFSPNESIQASEPNDTTTPVIPLQDMTNTRRYSISEFLTLPATPKRKGKHINYKIRSNPILTASERMQELQAIEHQKEQVKKQKVENARKREEKKVAKIVEKNKREENKIRKKAEKQEWLALKETLKKRKLEEKLEKQEAKKKAKQSPDECYVAIR